MLQKVQGLLIVIILLFILKITGEWSKDNSRLDLVRQ